MMCAGRGVNCGGWTTGAGRLPWKKRHGGWGMWEQIASWAEAGNSATGPFLNAVTEQWPNARDGVLSFLGNPWIRNLGLAVIVYATIRVIASVYSGDMQNSEMGPLGIRPHAAQRHDRKTILLPRLLIPMNMDGVHADAKFYYVYVDSRGKRRNELVHTMQDARIAVSPVRVPSVAATIFGQEIPDLATEDVCFPPVDLDQVPPGVEATPPRALDYARLHQVIENWREDDEAPLISIHKDVLEEVADARRELITTAAAKVRRAREGNALHRWLNGEAAKQRPNVVGSYYVKLEFSHNPWFVLTRHPDRELKMTAWLTVLTSMFAVLMEIWPQEPARTNSAPATAQSDQQPSRTTRPARVPRF